ncbi:gastrula zinc finger protein XlCGF17.1-like [Plodia interpunctella]|uniref:gastrula zinc finger protein XlCGF17.1-like n=1 Tax=Plodia interpunctella TaxID=58824 RepID=UPI0023675EB0|nr:gastrula zinc finger protein XlCGF17.1-like [Plodia interpunctella]
MVGTAMLLNILHCRQLCHKSSSQKSNRKKNRKLSQNERVSVFVKSENQDSQQKICRVCLKEGSISIYGNDFGNQEDVSEAFITFGGITIQSDDPYPKFLCKSCNSLLLGAILFRKTAQQSETILKQQENYEETANNDDDEEPSSSYVDNDDLITLDKLVKDQEERSYHCGKCDLEFQSFSEFCEHRASPEHEEVRRTCPICKKSYAALYLKNHLALHKQETSYMCDICGKKFIIKGQFTRHRVTHFVDNLPFKCSLCPYKGRFSESLKMHMKSHTGEKSYQCSQCAHRFVNKSNLSRHMLTHKGKHDYICASCGRGFYTKRDLELHLKVDHAGIKEHVCNICGKAFGYRKQMMKHQLKVHKRQKLRSGRMPLYLLAESKQHSEESV